MKKILFLLSLFFATSALAQTVIPGERQRGNVCYSVEEEVISEEFAAPVVNFDGNREVQFIDESPIDPNRRLENIPTFGLALWHHWIFSQQLFRAQREYADCVGGIKVLQRLLEETVPIDEGSIKDTVLAVREYVVPFSPVQRGDGKFYLPPSKEDAIAHARAAISSVNITVFHVSLCKQTLEWYERRVRAHFGR